MIHVERPVAIPATVTAALSKLLRTGETELEAARTYYSATPPPKKAYGFRKYKEFDVCRALDSLFHGKCAYCETPYRAVDALDVEHFRPKGKVQESESHPGYWWLAAVWTNLLPSCPPCNQRRKHVQYTSGMTPEEFERELQRRPTLLMGKGQAFPLKSSNWVANEGGDLTIEDPLLINPCERNPEQHLEWVFDRDANGPIWSADPVFAFVRPRTTPAGDEDEYAKASIAIYGLNRSGVIRERAACVKEFQLVSRPIVDVFGELASYPDPYSEAAAPLRKKLADYKANLNSLTQPNKKYSSMAAAYVREFEKCLCAL